LHRILLRPESRSGKGKARVAEEGDSKDKCRFLQNDNQKATARGERIRRVRLCQNDGCSKVAGVTLPGGEVDGLEDGFQALLDGLELGLGEVLGAGDLASAEVVDGEIEADAVAVAEGGQDGVAGFRADFAVGVEATGEGDVANNG
jgi:hypothetical protein